MADCYNVMRYVNPRFTYLLTYNASVGRSVTCFKTDTNKRCSTWQKKTMSIFGKSRSIKHWADERGINYCFFISNLAIRNVTVSDGIKLM